MSKLKRLYFSLLWSYPVIKDGDTVSSLGKGLRRATYALAILVVEAAIAVVVFSFAARVPQSYSFSVSLFVSDAGRSHGGFEYTASWNASLITEGGSGTLRLVQTVGLGDPLQKHEYAVTGLTFVPGREISIYLDGDVVKLVWVDVDTVWNGTYSRSYIASWGSDAPPGELRGTISQSAFPGLPTFWYIELRLKPI